MAERLQKILAQWGIASRREAEQMILAGRVRLNGAVVQLGQKADLEHDSIEIDGRPLQPIDRPQSIYLLLNKPVGVISTCHDPQGRSTVLDLLPQALRHHTGIHPVGRLDVASTGALLLTNDGAVTAYLTHPRHSIPKTYHVWVQGQPSEVALEHWRQGVMLQGRLTRPAEVYRLSTNARGQTCLRVVLWEGRNRQIRRVAEQLDHPVVRLHRVAIGPICLGSLASGQFRPLTQAEVRFLQSQVDQQQSVMQW